LLWLNGCLSVPDRSTSRGAEDFERLKQASKEKERDKHQLATPKNQQFGIARLGA
jgi:hypothetical protein